MKPIFIAGPCVIESAELLDCVAQRLVEINKELDTEIIFKASFDKANRTSITSFRGPGMEKGLQMLADVKEKYGLRLLTDIHESCQAAPVAEVVDVLQIPAFLCRQTDLLVAAAKTGKTINIKKAQFLSGVDMKYPVQKVRDTWAKAETVATTPQHPSPVTHHPSPITHHPSSNTQHPSSTPPEVWLCERGNSFGYNNLVVDFRNIPDMLDITPRVVMDCTHSVQRPGGGNGCTAGDRRFVPAMALAAKAFGANGYFFEVHPDPDKGLSDGPNMLKLEDLKPLIQQLM